MKFAENQNFQFKNEIKNEILSFNPKSVGNVYQPQRPYPWGYCPLWGKVSLWGVLRHPTNMLNKRGS